MKKLKFIASFLSIFALFIFASTTSPAQQPPQPDKETVLKAQIIQSYQLHTQISQQIATLTAGQTMTPEIYEKTIQANPDLQMTWDKAMIIDRQIASQKPTIETIKAAFLEIGFTPECSSCKAGCQAGFYACLNEGQYGEIICGEFWLQCYNNCPCGNITFATKSSNTTTIIMTVPAPAPVVAVQKSVQRE